jgi:hypothetical protein
MTGTRFGMSEEQNYLFYERLVNLGATVLHHGDCVGADAQAHSIACELGLFTVGHPPSNPVNRAWCECDELWPEKGYIERDRDIVNCCEILLATPKHQHEILRSGTWTTVRYARKVGKPYEILTR